MLPYLLSAVLGVTFYENPSILTVPVVQAAELTSTTSIAEYVRLKDDAGHFNGEFYGTLECESGGWKNIQSTVKDSASPNGFEESYGIPQWHVTAGNKNENGVVITKEMALDPRPAIDTAAWYFSQGLQNKWSCWRNLYKHK